MNILITNDDGFEAPGIAALYDALGPFGEVHLVAPITERSACSHTITLRGPVTVERIEHEHFGSIHVVHGTPADCVRLAMVELLDVPVDLVVSGINRGANAGVDTFYSGTVAGAREGAIMSVPSISVSQAIRPDVDVDWPRATEATRSIVGDLIKEQLPGPGFWNVNLPAPVPPDYRDRIRRVPVAPDPMPADFTRSERDGGLVIEFDWGKTYWFRDVSGINDYSVLRNGEVAVSTIPLSGRF